MSSKCFLLSRLYRQFKNRQSDGVLKHSALYLVFFAGVTVLNILLRKFYAVSLSIPAFGIFTAILALYNMLFTPIQVFPMVLTRKLSWLFKQKQESAAFSYHLNFTRFFSRLYVAYSLLLLLFLPLFQIHYHLDNILPLVFLVYMILLFALGSLMMPVFQARQEFVRVGWINLLSAFAKITFSTGVLVLAWRLGFDRIELLSKQILPSSPLLEFYDPGFFSVFSLGAFIFSGLVTLGVSSVLVFRLYRPHRERMQREGLQLKQLWHDTWPIFSIFVVFGIFRNIDEYFARHFLSGQENGIYGSLVSVGKSSLFLVSTIIFVLFPKLSSKMDDIQSSTRILIKGLLLAAAGGVCGIILISFFPAQVITLLTSSKYVMAAGQLKWFFLSYLPYAILLIIAQFFIVHRDKGFSIILLFCTIAGVVLFQFFHRNSAEIISVMAATGYTALTGSIGYFLIRYRRKS